MPRPYPHCGRTPGAQAQARGTDSMEKPSRRTVLDFSRRQANVLRHHSSGLSLVLYSGSLERRGPFWGRELPVPCFIFPSQGLSPAAFRPCWPLAGGVRLLSAPWRERTSRRNSLYALTDRRLIAITGEAALFFKGCSIYTRSFHKLRNVRLHPARNGAGDIILEYGGKKKLYSGKRLARRKPWIS